MNYEVGKEVIAIGFHSNDSEIESYPFLIEYIKNGLKLFFKTLIVKEHHKVAWEFDQNNEKKYDGFVLSSKDNEVYYNQYPQASYSQTSSDYDYAFVLNDEEDYHTIWDLTFYLKFLSNLLFVISLSGKKEQDKYDLINNHLNFILDEFSKVYPNKKLIQYEKNSKFMWCIEDI